MIQWTLYDLIVLRDAGVAIDRELIEAALAYENIHRDIAPCDCGAVSFTPHLSTCPRASVLFESNWYERVTDED